MKRNLMIILLIVSALSIVFVSCKKKKDSKDNSQVVWYSPEPGPNGTVPEVVLPDYIEDSVTTYITIPTGVNPPAINGEFLSHPHVLIHSTIDNDTITVYNDRYVAFYSANYTDADYVDFYGKQWDDEQGEFYQEVFRKLYVLGTGEDFTCYYLTEGYPNDLYAKQATVFSGKWDESYGGLRDFQVAVILLETSGNPNLAEPGSFRVLGDGDGLAQDTAWLSGKRTVSDNVSVSAEDAFSMFRIR